MSARHVRRGSRYPVPGTRCVGVIGAGQLDRTGAINSTYAQDGSFIVGSGGANDVLSAADEVIITVGHQPGRLVNKVRYVTCPGDRVRTVVTDLAVLERDSSGEFVLTGLLPAAGSDDRAAVDAVRARTGWDLTVARELTREGEPDLQELAQLRAYDPRRVFLRDRTKV